MEFAMYYFRATQPPFLQRVGSIGRFSLPPSHTMRFSCRKFRNRQAFPANTPPVYSRPTTTPKDSTHEKPFAAKTRLSNSATSQVCNPICQDGIICADASHPSGKESSKQTNNGKIKTPQIPFRKPAHWTVHFHDAPFR